MLAAQNVTISKKKYEELLASQAILEVQREIFQGKVQTHLTPKSLFDDLDNPKNSSI